MRVLLRGVVVVAAAIGVWCTAASAQRFISRGDAVRVDVLVTDAGKTVRNLTGRDFEVRDDNVPQQVALVEVEPLPLNLICVFDTSTSVAGPRLQHLTDAGRALTESLRNRDRIALVSFASRIRLHSALTTDLDVIRNGLAALQAHGTTSLRDAAFAGLALRESDPGRTLLLVFSDGFDTSSWLTTDRVLDTARRTDVVVYGVGFRPQTRMAPRRIVTYGSDGFRRSDDYTVPVPDDAGKFLDTLAAETGGRVLLADTDEDLRATFVATLAEFRDRYVLSYVPHGVSATGWHQLSVRLKGKSGKVAARRGYFVQ